MERKRILRILGGLIVVATLVLTACAGGGTSSPTPQDNTAPDNGQTMNNEEQPEATMADTSGEEEAAADNEFPDVLVLHPDAADVEVNNAAGTYVYVVPMMVADTIAYLQPELEARGWQPLGQPTVMGHLATLNLQMDKSRLTVSMQDNDLSQTTRVQMLLLQQ